MKHIGVLGGGQLGMLLTESIYRHGGSVSIYDPDSLAPASKMVGAGHYFNKQWTDIQGLGEFFSGVDAATYEFENVESTELYQFEKSKPIHPSVSVLYTTQDRAREKTFLLENGLPHAAFKSITDLSTLSETVSQFGYPCILKSSRGGYDGKGQFFLANETDANNALSSLKGGRGDYRGVLEEALNIELEVSCIVARSPQGQEVIFPVFENIHKNQILDFTIFPARIPAAVEKKVHEIALDAAQKLGACGLLTTEFFITKTQARHAQGSECEGWQIYINEFAPRPHNSGHVTRTACTLSQFDALARIMLDIPLSEPKIIAPGTFCMGNLLGDLWLEQGRRKLDLSALANHPNVIDIVLYGKHEARAGRKMGHFVTYADDSESALRSACEFRSSLIG
ncbi:5-(carboxyamino)imidazole ribonucleotide synthase [soil metagenome]